MYCSEERKYIGNGEKKKETFCRFPEIKLGYMKCKRREENEREENEREKHFSEQLQSDMFPNRFQQNE